ncbi:unnamed protein product, partial [Owenia fusiformis]
ETLEKTLNINLTPTAKSKVKRFICVDCNSIAGHIARYSNHLKIHIKSFKERAKRLNVQGSQSTPYLERKRKALTTPSSASRKRMKVDASTSPLQNQQRRYSV